jgi:hypothetical protein
VISALLGVFCGGLYWKTSITIAGFQVRVGSLFFLVSPSESLLPHKLTFGADTASSTGCPGCVLVFERPRSTLANRHDSTTTTTTLIAWKAATTTKNQYISLNRFTHTCNDGNCNNKNDEKDAATDVGTPLFNVLLYWAEIEVFYMLASIITSTVKSVSSIDLLSLSQ